MRRTLLLTLCLTCFVTATQAQSTIKMKPSLNHIAICSKNLKASSEFYSNVLGLESIRNPFSDTTHLWFSIGAHQQLHIIKANCPTDHNINNHMCFSVPSMDAFVKHLDQLNIKYGNWTGESRKIQHRPDGVLQIYFQDPDGYWIEVNNAQ